MSATFAVLDAAVAEERTAWVELWAQSPTRDVFAHPAYVSLFLQDGHCAKAAILSEPDGSCVLYPFILRDLTVEPAWRDQPGPLSDITTAYGYGGAIWWGGPNAESIAQNFWISFDAWTREMGCVAEFVRFAVGGENLLPYPGTRTLRSHNIVRSLDHDPETIWMDFDAKVRKNVKKAKRCRLVVDRDDTGAELDAFLGIYASTMNRREAHSTYYFSRDFFEAIHLGLAGSFAYFHARLDGEIVSSELVLVSGDALYSFLGGTDSDHFDLRPNDLLKFEIIEWGRQSGKKRYVLGGGAQPGDGIERYKRSFAPGGIVEFTTGQRVLDPGRYEELVASRGVSTETSFFPAYRSLP